MKEMNYWNKILKFLAAYSLLYYRPEFFIPASRALGRSALETFIIVWCWTSFLTVVTYYSPDFVKKINLFVIKTFQKIFRQKTVSPTSNRTKNNFLNVVSWIKGLIKELEQKFQNCSHQIVKKIVGYSPYFLFLTFTFPVVPSLDTISVVMLRLLRVRYAFRILILINTIKFFVITAICYDFF